MKSLGLFDIKFKATILKPPSSDADTLDPIHDLLGLRDAIPDFLDHRDDQTDNKVPHLFTRSESYRWHH